MRKTKAQGPPKQQLAAERMRRHWTQQEVADQLGTTPGNVSRWERGITSPSPYFRRKLCELFGRSAHELGLAWEASEVLPAQMRTSPTVALKEAQTHTGRGGADSVQTAIEAASCSRDGSWALFVVKATPPEMRGQGLAMPLGGLPRPEQGQEPFAQAFTPRLPIPQTGCWSWTTCKRSGSSLRSSLAAGKLSRCKCEAGLVGA